MAKRKPKAAEPATEEAPIVAPPAITSAAPEPSDIEQVIVWLTEGHRDADIRQAIAAKWPGADAAALQEAAVAHFASAAHCDIDVVNGWAMEAYRDLYRRMIAIGDFAGAAKAVKELTTLANKYVRPDTEDQPGEEANSEAVILEGE